MGLFDPPRCPQCQTTVDLRPLYRVAAFRGVFLPRNTCIDCPTCGIPMRVDQRRTIGTLAATLLACVGVTLVRGIAERGGWLPGPSDARDVASIALIALVAAFALRIPKLARLRFPDPGEAVRFPLRVATASLSPAPAVDRVDSRTGTETEPEPEPETGAGTGTGAGVETYGPSTFDSEKDARDFVVAMVESGNDPAEMLDEPPPNENDAVIARVLDGADWVCPKCHETNPGNFPECWKCQAIRPELSGEGPAPPAGPPPA